MKKALTVLVGVCILFTLFTGCKPKESKNLKLSVSHAGSLAQPIRETEDSFAKENDGDVVFEDESHGSVTVVKNVCELHKLIDVVAVADYSLIPQYLIPDYADWYIQFASNKLVIAYTDNSRFNEEINEDNWYDVIRRDGVEFGYSNPDADPCGYRTRLIFKLASIYYEDEELENKIVAACPMRNIRPKAVELVAQLQSGELDYAFEYLSVAVQNGLEYMELPDQLSFGSVEYADFYGQATFTMKDGKVVKGAPICYGITIPKNALNQELAIEFVDYLLSEKGKEIFEQNGQPFVQFKTNVPVSELPEALRKYFEE